MSDVRNAAWSPLPREGSRVIVTGAAGGLGQALMHALRDAGAETVGFDLPRAVDSLPAGEDRLVGVDITDADAVRQAVEEAAQELSGIDAVVGAAGIVDTIHRAKSFPADRFRGDVEGNLTGQFLLAQAAYPYLLESAAASIVFVASGAGIDGLPGQASYAASKAGLIGLATTLAGEWVGDGIRVNAVAPGLFATPKVRSMPESTLERMLTGAPMGRVGSLDEIVGPILFLLSPAAGYITGRTLRLDGGGGINTTGLFR